MNKVHSFRSRQFRLQGAEDEATNPGRFGKSLAEWLSVELGSAGYATEVIAEDWGWCVMCERGDYQLWVGCGNVVTEAILASSIDQPPCEDDIIWQVFAEIEVPFYMIRSNVRRWLGWLDTATPLAKLEAELERILRANPGIEFCDAP